MGEAGAARLDLVAGTGVDHDVERDNVGVTGLDGHEAQFVVEFGNRIGVGEDLVFAGGPAGGEAEPEGGEKYAYGECRECLNGSTHLSWPRSEIEIWRQSI